MTMTYQKFVLFVWPLICLFFIMGFAALMGWAIRGPNPRRRLIGILVVDILAMIGISLYGIFCT